jgi:antitoxin ParD1/3/4
MAARRRAKPSPASINISLPRELREFVDAQVRSGGYASASEYLRTLLREARERDARRARDDAAGGEAGRGTTAAARYRDALDLLRFAHETAERNLRREGAAGSDEELRRKLEAWKRADAGTEEVPGHLRKAPERLERLLRDGD